MMKISKEVQHSQSIERLLRGLSKRDRELAHIAAAMWLMKLGGIQPPCREPEAVLKWREVEKELGVDANHLKVVAKMVGLMNSPYHQVCDSTLSRAA